MLYIGTTNLHVSHVVSLHLTVHAVVMKHRLRCPPLPAPRVLFEVEASLNEGALTLVNAGQPCLRIIFDLKAELQRKKSDWRLELGLGALQAFGLAGQVRCCFEQSRRQSRRVGSPGAMVVDGGVRWRNASSVFGRRRSFPVKCRYCRQALAPSISSS